MKSNPPLLFWNNSCKAEYLHGSTPRVTTDGPTDLKGWPLFPLPPLEALLILLIEIRVKFLTHVKVKWWIIIFNSP